MRKILSIVTLIVICMFYVVCPAAAFAGSETTSDGSSGTDVVTETDDQDDEGDNSEADIESDEAPPDAIHDEEDDSDMETMDDEEEIDLTGSLTPGSDIDMSKCKINTRITISKTGEYWLSGDTTHVRLYIDPVKNANIVVHFKDGTNINTSALSNTGKATYAIKVCETEGATVTLSTCAGATTECSGYIWGVGIAKNGTKTKLIFDTDDHSNPGSMSVACGSISPLKDKNTPCIIGAEPGGKYTCGNMVFNGGSWRISTTTHAAALGASPGSSVDGITINGGTIYCSHGYGALSTLAGPGIGVTDGGRLDNLVINGGKVTAKGVTADSTYGDNMDWAVSAGIGLGTGGGRVGNITINGGKVYAYGGTTGQVGCAGIGVGENEMQTTRYSVCDSVTINGGYVKAVGGLDKGGLQADEVTINGGEVDTTGGRIGPGIRADEVEITGGEVDATGGINFKHAGAGNPTLYGGHGIRGENKIHITGGMVFATRGDSGRNYGLKCSNTIIDGGYVNSSNNSNTVHNSNGDKVQETVFLLKDLKGDAFSKADISNIEPIGQNYDYGLKDVHTDSNGLLFFYIPEDMKIGQADSNNQSFFGSVVSGHNYDTDKNNYLNEGVRLDVYTVGLDSYQIQSASLGTGGRKLSDISTIVKGYNVLSYALDEDGKNILADDKGKLAAGVKNSDGKVLTDSNGTWTDTEVISSLTRIYANIEPIKYNIKFNSNRPSDASGEMKGSMSDLTGISYDVKTKLPSNGYHIKGYQFAGWNTKPNGMGDSIEDEGTAYELCSKEGDTCTLYAMWERAKYTVTYDPGDGSGSVQSEEVEYDSAYTFKTMKELGFTAPDGMKFMGWSNMSLGHLFKDGYSGKNFCSENSSTGKIQGYHLTALYMDESSAMIAVTRDHQGITDLDGKIKLSDGSAKYNVAADKTKKGVYLAAGIPAGEYDVEIPGYDSDGLKLKVDSSGGILYADYYTVSVLGDEGLKAVVGDNQAELVIASGDKINLAAKSDTDDNGVAFSHWEIHNGSNSGIDLLESSQEIKINDTLTLFASARAAKYTVEFDANVPAQTSSRVRGQMFGIPAEYGDEFTLDKNTLKLKGYKFTGWNTQADGSGTAYADEAKVTNLSGTDGATAKLYGQWQPIQYKVEFDANGGSSSFAALSLMSAGMTTQVFTYDEAQKLEKCRYARSGYKFTGWNTVTDGSGEMFADGEEVMNISWYDDTITLYAQWVKDKSHGGGGGEGGHNGHGARTGDDTSILPLILIAAAALVGIIAAVFVGRRKQ